MGLNESVEEAKPDEDDSGKKGGRQEAHDRQVSG